jgi:ribosomal protein S18 acetylase RimI-like enzyme
MRLRAPRRDEAAAVHAVILARHFADIGRPDYLRKDVLDDWDRPELDLARDVFVVEDDDGTLLGWADVDEHGARVAVHPDHEGRGIGTLLRGATEARMRELDIPVRQIVVPANRAAVEHLRAVGYEPVEVHQRMRAAIDAVPAPLAVPVRRFDLEAEGPAVHELIEAAFSEIQGTARRPYANWRAEVTAKSPPAFRLALDDDEGLVATAVGHRWDDGVGYVAMLAVAARARGRGHGRALLLALLDAFRAAGLTVAELSVAGTNATATGLYESAGMTPDVRIERWGLGGSPG